MTQRRPRSPAQSYNAGIDHAASVVLKVIDEMGDERMFPVGVKIVTRLDEIKRRTWHRRSHGERLAGGEDNGG